MTLYVDDFRKMVTKDDIKPFRFKTDAITGKSTDPIYIKRKISLGEKINMISSICSYSDYKKGMLFEINRIYFIAKAYLDNVNFPKMKDEYKIVNDNGKVEEKTRMIDNIQEIVEIVLNSQLWENILAYAGKDIEWIDKCIDEEIDEYRRSGDILTGLQTLISHVDDIIMDAREKGLTEIIIDEAQKIREALGDEDQKQAAQEILKLLQNDTGKK